MTGRTTRLDVHADAWASTVCEAVGRRYPWASQHTVTGPGDTDATPERLHPAFHGSFDWHSCVHMLWSGATLLATAPDALAPNTRERLVALLDERLTPERTAVEAATIRRRPGFERPYGWAWLLQLAAALRTLDHPRAGSWADAVAPVADAVADGFTEWLPRLTAPVRHGVHFNTAFGLALAWDAAPEVGRPGLRQVLADRAVAWFGDDTDYAVRWELSGHDFLSAGLSEAVLMRRVLPPDAFGAWLRGFLPDLATDGDVLLTVPPLGDQADGKAAHQWGLSLSRAWHLRELAPYLGRAEGERALAAASGQVSAVEDAISGGDFMATHWLVSFALKAELARPA